MSHSAMTPPHAMKMSMQLAKCFGFAMRPFNDATPERPVKAVAAAATVASQTSPSYRPPSTQSSRYAVSFPSDRDPPLFVPRNANVRVAAHEAAVPPAPLAV